MSETRATPQRRGRIGSARRPKDPVVMFPPGRYGRRRDGRRHLAVPIVFGVLVLLVSFLIAVRLYRQYGDPDYDAQIIGWTDVTATQMTIKFTVRVPPGSAASCLLRARSYDGVEVGSRTVTVTATGRGTTIEAAEIIPTTAKAAVGDIVRCSPVP